MLQNESISLKQLLCGLYAIEDMTLIEVRQHLREKI
jgi:hypothetical protein